MTAYSFPMDTNPGWTVQGLWTFGHPLGYGSDPANGHTGSNVYGYNIVGTGQYTNSMPKYCLTTTALDCSNLANVQLKFWRWLGIEDSQYDRATIEVSSNGTTWRTVWAHNGGTTVETGWSQYVYDLSATADRQSTVYVRWGLGPTDSSGTYCGWNIDDVEIWGIQLDPCVPLSYTVGDVNADSAVDGLDVQTFVSILLNPADPWTQAQKCAADCNGDHEVDLNDVGPFITLLLGQ